MTTSVTSTRHGFSFTFIGRYSIAPSGYGKRACYTCELCYYTEDENLGHYYVENEEFPEGWGVNGAWLYCKDCLPCTKVGATYG